MVNYRSEATEEEKHEVFQSLKTTKSHKKKKKHSKDGNGENISSTENILNTVSEESDNKNHKSKKKKRTYEESVVIVDCKEEKPKKKKQKYLKENVESDKNEIPAAKGKPDESNVETKENDSKEPANADGKKKRKARHAGREERKKEKAKKKELIANGTITPETKVKNKKRKRKSKKNKKDKDSNVSQADNTPRPKGDIPLEDASTAEYKAKEFLKTWNKDKANWKFVKTRQNWLVHHLYNPEKIDDKMFKVVLKYLSGMKGFSRETTLEQAKSVLNVASGDATAKIHKKIVLSDKPGEIQLARAREVIQML